MDQRINIITLGVNNLKVSTEFYVEKFGWKRSEMGNEQIIFFNLNGIVLALYNRAALAEDALIHQEGSGFKGFTLAYNARSENEVDNIITGLKNKGVKIIKEPQKVFWGGYSSYISDPDGNLWEIAYNPYLSLDENGMIK
jgi:uncharacterized protein